MTITEFLLARVAEDEDEAARMGCAEYYDGGWSLEHEVHIRKECAAKRAIIDRHATCDDVSYGDAATCPEVSTFAAVYSDHPDYQEEWKP